MLRRLLALVVLVALVGIALYYWKYRPGTLEGTKETLGSVGAALGDKFQATKTSAAVKAAFELHGQLAPLDIDVDGRDEGVVALQGEVPSEELRGQAQQVAQSVPDVRQVVNELRVNPSLPPPSAGGRTIGESLDDRALEGKVNLAFSLDSRLKGTDIKVHAYRRHVTLRGRVDSAAQRELAAEIARRTADVLGVTDEMAGPGQPQPPAATTGSGPPSAAAPSPSAAKSAQQAVAANPNLGRYGLTVREEGGGLVLAGRVKTQTEKDLAFRLARDAARAPVRNEVEVQR